MKHIKKIDAKARATKVDQKVATTKTQGALSRGKLEEAIVGDVKISGCSFRTQ